MAVEALTKSMTPLSTTQSEDVGTDGSSASPRTTGFQSAAMLTCKPVLISFAALIVAGCAMIPKYERPDAPIAPEFLANNRDLRIAALNVKQSAARAAFFPSVTLTASLGTTSSEFDEAFEVGSGWSLSPRITLPNFNAGRSRADLESAKVGTRIEVENYQKAIERAFREVADALAATRTYTEQLQAQTRLIDAQQKRFDLATARYREGDADYLEVLSAQQDLYGAQQGHLETRLDQLASRISLYKSLGGGWK